MMVDKPSQPTPIFIEVSIKSANYLMNISEKRQKLVAHLNLVTIGSHISYFLRLLTKT